MAGIYVHIPFCKKACTYCDFHFSTSLVLKPKVVAGILQELEMQKDFFASDESISTIYFGGGTPSVLEAAELVSILAQIRMHFPVENDVEITLEANPDDLSPAYLQELYAAGINRLSIGVQSFREGDMALMNRSHNVQQARKSIRDAQNAGINNLTIDLIYGIPGLSEADWKANLEEAIATGVPHISAYALTVEPQTQLASQVKKGMVAMPPDDHVTEQFHFMSERLQAAGFEHYEISNFARPGHRSRHNSAYWQGKPYLGIGPSAHSFKPFQRSWNLRNNALYVRALGDGRLPVESEEQLSLMDRANERIMTGLRLAEGIHLRDFLVQYGWDLAERESTNIQKFTAQGWLNVEGEWLRLTAKGKMVSDYIIAEFFQV